MFRRKQREAQIVAEAKARADEALMAATVERAVRLQAAREAAQADLNAALGLREQTS